VNEQEKLRKNTQKVEDPIYPRSKQKMRVLIKGTQQSINFNIPSNPL
jgi:hypothetical protein